MIEIALPRTMQSCFIHQPHNISKKMFMLNFSQYSVHLAILGTWLFWGREFSPIATLEEFHIN